MDAKKILVVAPHVDDEINCAGALFMAEDADKLILALSPCYESVPPGYPHDILIQESKKSATILHAEIEYCDWPVRQLGKYRQEILERLIIVRDVFEPDCVICPSSTDTHQDHEVVHGECLRAFRNVPLLLGWESPNNQRIARTDFFVQLTSEALEKKLAVYHCYESQQFRKHLSTKLFAALATVRGMQARTGTGLAEAYEVLNVTV